MEEKILETNTVENKKENQTKFSKKKGIFLALILITVICIGIIGGSFLVPKTVKGQWELIINPEISQSEDQKEENKKPSFYTFSKPDKYGEGTYKTFFDGGVEEGKYTLSQQDGKEKINMGTEYLEYKITGSKLLGNAKLVITYPEYVNEETGETTPAEDYVFVQSKAPDYSKSSFDTYKTEASLIGKWTTEERTLPYYMYSLSYTETVEFMKNGIMTIHYKSKDLALDRYMYYAYTVKGDKLTFSLVTDKDTKYEVAFMKDKEGNLAFTNDTTNGSIFADAFFSDVTYSPAK